MNARPAAPATAAITVAHLLFMISCRSYFFAAAVALICLIFD
jgi:hypothetical protein